MEFVCWLFLKKSPTSNSAVERHSFACGKLARQGHSSGELSIKLSKINVC